MTGILCWLQKKAVNFLDRSFKVGSPVLVMCSMSHQRTGPFPLLALPSLARGGRSHDLKIVPASPDIASVFQPGRAMNKGQKLYRFRLLLTFIKLGGIITFQEALLTKF